MKTRKKIKRYENKKRKQRSIETFYIVTKNTNLASFTIHFVGADMIEIANSLN